MKEAQRLLTAATAERHFAVTSDLCNALGPEEGLRTLQRWVRQLGELMLIWSDLRGQAIAMRASGWQAGTRL